MTNATFRAQLDTATRDAMRAIDNVIMSTTDPTARETALEAMLAINTIYTLINP